MLKQLFLIFFAISIAHTATAQVTHRYKDHIFNDISVTKDLTYFVGAPKADKKSYLFDLYTPNVDTAKKRPLMIWMHGGGFKFGSKTSKGVKVWADDFAKRGYVCVSINYRLSKHNPLFNFDTLMKATFYATQDAKRAIAYFRNNAAKYGIDPDKIVLGGNSAGGMMALHAAYTKNNELGRMAHLSDQEIQRVGMPNQPIFAVINYWGAIFNLDWLSNAKTPIIAVHGSEDGLVPIRHKDAPLHGSLDIYDRAEKLKIPNTLKVYEGYSHELQKSFNPLFEGPHAKKRWLESAQFTADYLYSMMYPAKAKR
ncbi:alpha/beta hydrolase [Mucilaginibacter myungsuensis]|uniref:Alpha/beta hydrolase n=1 Tax=Mucilaginibacter myungsuensis TaxID=649104 RepID=A0A929PYB4_9SPHI|nr:alpha/beta hydrolase [Mucilaginibacter myungsuensis]MBE9663275.1 alpha/beta hydrolase [Mucilaginibacter myungsuensis]MDN3600010.1 alpha/beta hydrolase [Mucilaginibacter myungsuensis]